jgi:TRAP-type C4-dicarboxylate transport system permease small subunit
MVANRFYTNAKKRYAQAMEWLYIVCVSTAAFAMLIMTFIIPYGVFMRYVMNSPASWPEPAGILLMVLFSFLGGAAAYRAAGHIAVTTVVRMLSEANQARMFKMADVGMAVVATFMLVWGVRLVRVVWYQSIAEFPDLSVGITYMPIPIGGLITLLFVIERMWCGEPPATSITFRDQPQTE